MVSDNVRGSGPIVSQELLQDSSSVCYVSRPVRRSPRLLLKSRQDCLTPLSARSCARRRKCQKIDIQELSSLNINDDYQDVSKLSVYDEKSLPDFSSFRPVELADDSTTQCVASVSECTSSGFVGGNRNFQFGGLPQDKCALYLAKRHIKNFYEWQKECISDERLLAGCNMVISLPTGAGKTLVAELLMLREVLVKERSTLLILPYVAIVQEKIQSLSIFGDTFDVWIEEYAASKGRLPPIKRRKNCSIYVATIEKANMLINSLVEAGRMGELGLVIVDELHMLGEGCRGAILEQALAKFQLKGCGQIIGITATLANGEEIAQFLNASIFSTNFRPVELVEKVKIGNCLYIVEGDGTLKPELDFGENKLINRDPDGLVFLLHDVIPKRSVIIFCPTKLTCENVCETITRIAPKNLRVNKVDARRDYVAMLKEDGDGRSYPGLETGIMSGVAFHHSGLTIGERKIVEAAFQDGAVSILCSTSTLAAGVNLPARRVIIKRPLVGRVLLKKTQYLQMVGRAGRAGFDEKGEAVTIVHPGAEELKFREMLVAPLEDCRSTLGNKESLCSFLLDLVALKMAEMHDDLISSVKNTLFGIQNEGAAELVEECLMELSNEGFITVTTNQFYAVTNLGVGAFAASFSPSETKKLNNILIENLFQYRLLSKEEKRLLVSFGLGEDRLVKCLVNRPKMKEGDAGVRVHIAFMMQRLWKQEPLWSVSERFSVSRGWLQSTLQSTCSQACSVARFSEKVPCLWPLKHLLPDLVRKLRECKEQELIPLLAMDGVKRARARQLYDAGFKTVGSVAKANPSVLIASIGNISRRQALVIIRSAQVIIREQIAEKMEEIEELGASSKEFLEALTIEV